MPRKHRWSVTWPTRPHGVHTVLVRAVDSADAVRVATEKTPPVDDEYQLAFDYAPCVWRLAWPYRLRSRHVAGPDFPDMVLGEPGFIPEPLNLDAIAAAAVDVIRVCDANGDSLDAVRAAVGQVVGNLAPHQVAHVLAHVTEETKEINRFSNGMA
ncbi:hypothetical protein [Streptomyces sp. NBC_00687]|uniref:hypothetical protein n=1 Tax=Streptomyces sp. NBC_00687 TaxID=2975807 RepID=UPI0022509F5D|nr:hypothetical protein [Streptomyces sp. NBC_00687]MCX4919945.1 hypothetical protein [Streptomyces sp. NBC_00687]